ncbi:unnamed protein product, partial [Leptidea sinapis]
EKLIPNLPTYNLEVIEYAPYHTVKLNKAPILSSTKAEMQNWITNEGAHKGAIHDEDKKNRKALVISLHGWSGVGKNYVTNLVAEAIYLNGMQSKFVKIFMGKKDFDCSDIEKTQKELIDTVKKIVKECPTSLIIFDEIHEMCHSILDAIKPMLDHHHKVDGIDFRDAIFIFISNIGGKEIGDKLLELYSEGVKRSEVEFHNFEPMIRRTAYNTGKLNFNTYCQQFSIKEDVKTT